jgi:hypothetical protein
MPVQDARDLHADITKLLNAIEELRSHAAAAPTDGNISVELQGNRF